MQNHDGSIEDAVKIVDEESDIDVTHHRRRERYEQGRKKEICFINGFSWGIYHSHDCFDYCTNAMIETIREIIATTKANVAITLE